MLGLASGQRFMVGWQSQLLHFGEDGRIRMEDGNAIPEGLQDAILMNSGIITPVTENDDRQGGKRMQVKEYTRTVDGVDITLINPPGCETKSYRMIIGMAEIWSVYAKRRYGDKVRKMWIEWNKEGDIIRQAFELDGERGL